MFLKILKTDFKYYSRNFFSVIVGGIISVLFLLICKLVFNTTINTIDNVMTVVLISIYTYIVVMSIKIFKKKFIDKEASLMLSLPVKKYQHLLSAVIITLFWLVIFFVSMSMMIMWLFEQSDFVTMIRVVFGSFKNSNIVGILSVISMCVYNISIWCVIYLCCAIPYTVYFRKWPKVIGIVFCGIFSTLQMNTYKWLFEKVYWMVESHGEVFSITVNILINLMYGLIWFLLCVYLLDKKVQID